MKKVFMIAVFQFFVLASFSQSDIIALQYSVGFGTGEMHDYISNVSWRGFTFNYRSLVRSNIGVGFELGWNVFYEKFPDFVYEYEHLTFAGTQWRYGNYWPILGAIDYYFRTDGRITGNAGLGIGNMLTLQETYTGEYFMGYDGGTAWQFALRPELGVMFEVTPFASINLATRYYYGFKINRLPAQGFFTVNIGVVYTR